jgi:MoaA/NifB/PqqE/SkfB family radical SAM enzyme
MNPERIYRKLIYNSLRYRFLKLTGRPGPLQSISLEITHRCFCRCQMCNIWKIPNKVKDLPLINWQKLLASPSLHGLREIDITGGEPFLRDDLRVLLKWISFSKPQLFPELKTVAITTNGILTEQILATTEEIIRPLAAQGIDLILVCGMDAANELHDEIRNLPNAWQKLSATISGLKKLRSEHSNLILGIKTTIIPANVQQLDRIVDYADENGLFTIILPRIITGNRFANLELERSLSFSDDDLRLIRRFYEGPSFAWDGHRLAVLNYIKTGKVDKPCSAGFNTLFVRHNGEVFPCPLIENSLGNIKQNSLSFMLASVQARRFRRGIGTYAECKVCTEPGLERIAWPFEGFTCLRQLVRMGPDSFMRLARHMGLDKYF